MWSSKKPSSSNKLRFSGTLWIAADIHLGPDGPKTASGFYQFLNEAATHCDALILCGDIFNAWIGDDQVLSPEPWLATALKHLQQFGQQKALYLMRGNRDFLLGKQLAEAVHGTLLPDHVLITTDYFRFVLTHGDELCIDDHAYQRFRRIVRNRGVQAVFHALPLRWRRDIANHFRERSKAAGRHKSYRITDVNIEACKQLMARYQVESLIHGHTHRPALHPMPPQPETHRRIVLPDWELDHAQPPRSGWLSLHAQQVSLHQLGLPTIECDLSPESVISMPSTSSN